VTPLASPFAGYVSCLAIDPHAPNRLWATSSQTGLPASVTRSDNGGTSWVNCTGNLPPIPKNSVAADPADARRAWVAADVGVYETRDLGATWARFGTGLPNALAVDLLLHARDRKLFCATRNRGVWSADLSGHPSGEAGTPVA
jgi:photosystem II stability/assembly factor-like uncharacterized protein